MGQKDQLPRLWSFLFRFLSRLLYWSYKRKKSSVKSIKQTIYHTITLSGLCCDAVAKQKSEINPTKSVWN